MSWIEVFIYIHILQYLSRAEEVFICTMPEKYLYTSPASENRRSICTHQLTLFGIMDAKNLGPWHLAAANITTRLPRTPFFQSPLTTCRRIQQDNSNPESAGSIAI